VPIPDLTFQLSLHISVSPPMASCTFVFVIVTYDPKCYGLKFIRIARRPTVVFLQIGSSQIRTHTRMIIIKKPQKRKLTNPQEWTFANPNKSSQIHIIESYQIHRTERILKKSQSRTLTNSQNRALTNSRNIFLTNPHNKSVQNWILTNEYTVL
jgi:hypothetical protein